MSRPDTLNIPPCLIFIDKEGHWYHKGAEMIHRGFIQLFYQNMDLDSQGRYVINWNGNACYVDVEDTAFVVYSVVYEDADPYEKERFIIGLNDDTEEDLLPDSLYVGRGNVLYCRVKNNSFPARFNRAAYYQLARYIEEENGSYYLPLNGKKRVISQKTMP